MMTAYQPQPGMHPAMQHGHPGMPPNPQHMGQPMMHPGQGQSHASQTQAMMAMQPGANGPMGGMPGGQHPGGGGIGMPGQPGQSMAGGNPNAHALSHINPQAQMMQQAQMAQMQAANPQLALQQQQQMMAHRAAMQARANGMMGMPQGGMTPQQIQQMQQFQQQQGMHGGQVQLPAHLMQQQMALRMQQQQAQQQAQQSQQQQQMQQQLAMQHANSQQSNQGQPSQGSQSGQQGHQPQMRPPSRIDNPNQQNQSGPQPPPQPGQQAQPTSQQPPQQNQQPTAQPGQQQGISQQQQQQAQQQQHMHLQQQQRMQMMARQQLQRQQMQAQAQAQAQQQQQQRPTGMFILHVNLLANHLSNFNSQNGKDLNMWTEFVDKHFHPEGRLLHSFDETPAGGKVKQYEVLRPTIARYFWTYFESGAHSLQLHAEQAREFQMPENRTRVQFSSATLSVSYPTGARLEMSGQLGVLFAPQSELIECLEIQQTSFEELITRSEIERRMNEFSPMMDTKSPKMAKKNLPKAQQKMQQTGFTIDHLPKVNKGTMGVTSRVQQFLEVGETMCVMSELMHFAQEKKLRPEAALDAWVQQQEGQGGQQQGTPQINLPPNGVQMGNRTLSMGNMQMPGQQGQFSSPNVSNMNLPMQQANGMNGSPHIPNHPGLQPGGMNVQGNSHTPSPHQSNMAAPPMVPQHSQQGTNSSAASASTSPNVNNKRRRSAVKMEEEGPDANQGGNRIKPSPRMSKKAKPGG